MIYCFIRTEGIIKFKYDSNIILACLRVARNLIIDSGKRVLRDELDERTESRL